MALGLPLLATPGGAHATAFERFTLSGPGLGVANAMGADAEHVASMGYNPSALAFQERTHFEAGVMRETGHTEAASGRSEPSRTLYLHDAYATFRRPDSPLGYGLGLNRPFRMDSDYTGEFSSPGAATRTELDLVNLQPTAAYRLRPGLAVSAGANYYRALDFEYSSVAPGGGEIRRRGDGAGWGGTVGLQFWREGWSAAVTYTSGADLTLRGENLSGNTFRLPGR
ncbi:MAG: OmpP1/FadL family transporter, partial [Thiohalorhabdaceae bacterium]